MATISLIPYDSPLKATGLISIDITALRLWLTEENGRLLIRDRLFQKSRRTLVFTRFPESRPSIIKISHLILTLAGTEQMAGRAVDIRALSQDFGTFLSR